MRQLIYFFIVTWVLGACSGSLNQQETRESATSDSWTTYKPCLASITIQSEIVYPSGLRAALYDDRELEELANMTTEDGSFVLQVPDLAVNEVYFLKLTGERSAFGQRGVAWEERVPIYVNAETKVYRLLGKAYSGAESVSKMRFYMEGDEVQTMLNGWQEEINTYAAALENQIAQSVTLGKITSTSKSSRRRTLDEGLARISHEWIFEEKPNLASLFLIYRQYDHRQQHEAYQKVYSQTPLSAQQSKYGIDLSRRLVKIHTPIDSVLIKGHSILADGRLMPLDTAALGEYPYWLLYFWSTRNDASIKGTAEVYEVVDKIGSTRIAPVFISIDEVFSRWRDRSQELGLEYSYLVRRESRRLLLNTLYLDDVPRILLVTSDGVVLEEDLDLQELENVINNK